LNKRLIAGLLAACLPLCHASRPGANWVQLLGTEPADSPMFEPFGFV
jgi:hypothetical protein